MDGVPSDGALAPELKGWNLKGGFRGYWGLSKLDIRFLKGFLKRDLQGFFGGCIRVAWRPRGLSKWDISRVIIGVTPFRILITLLITYLLSPLGL